MANAPVPVPRTFGVSEFEASAYLNSVRDALNFLLNPPIAQLIQNTVQSIPNSTITPVSYDGSVVDTYGMHSNSTNNTRAVAQIAGWYYVSGIDAFASNSTGARVARLRKTGTDVVYFDVWDQAVNGQPTASATAGMLFLNVGDYIEVGAYQTSGGALNTFTTGPQAGMTVIWKHA